MNSTIFFSFLLIHTLILSIYPCIHFQNQSDGQCRKPSSSPQINPILQCDFNNPQTHINTSLCKMKFWIINITISNLDELRELILNNKTMMDVINLFQNTVSKRHNPLIITIKDLLSSTNHVELTIDQQWLENLFGHYQNLSLSWSLSFNARNWSQVNLTIHTDAMIYMILHKIRLYLRQTGLDNTCTVFVFEGTFTDQQWCKRYITLINNNKKPVSWPQKQSQFTMPSMFIPFVDESFSSTMKSTTESVSEELIDTSLESSTTTELLVSTSTITERRLTTKDNVKRFFKFSAFAFTLIVLAGIITCVITAVTVYLVVRLIQSSSISQNSSNAPIHENFSYNLEKQNDANYN